MHKPCLLLFVWLFVWPHWKHYKFVEYSWVHLYFYFMTAQIWKTLGLFAWGRHFFFYWKSFLQLLCVKLSMKRKEHRGFRLASLFRHRPMIKHLLVWKAEYSIIYKPNAFSKWPKDPKKILIKRTCRQKSKTPIQFYPAESAVHVVWSATHWSPLTWEWFSKGDPELFLAWFSFRESRALMTGEALLWKCFRLFIFLPKIISVS